MAPIPYRVVNSQKVANEFRALLLAPPRRGLDAVLQVVRVLIDALKWVPADIGESTEELPASGTIMRRVLREPLTVEFAVNEQERVVFLRRFHLWPVKTG